MEEVVRRINGSYLDFVYPKSSIEAHFELLWKKYESERETSDTANDNKVELGSINDIDTFISKLIQENTPFTVTYLPFDREEVIMNLKAKEELQEQLLELVLHVRCFTDDEYADKSSKLFEYSDIPKEEVLKIILM